MPIMAAILAKSNQNIYQQRSPGNTFIESYFRGGEEI